MDISCKSSPVHDIISEGERASSELGLQSAHSSAPSQPLLADKYQIGIKIGSGSFGEIYLAKNIRTGEDVAVKVEHVNATTQGQHGSSSQLKREAKIYYKLDGEGNRTTNFQLKETGLFFPNILKIISLSPVL